MKRRRQNGKGIKNGLDYVSGKTLNWIPIVGLCLKQEAFGFSPIIISTL